MIVAPVVHLRVSVEGSSPPGPPVEGNTWRQHTGEGSRAPRLVALALQILVEQEESKKQQQQQQRGGPQRPGAPSGQHGRLRSGGGALRVGHDPGLWTPSQALQTREGERRVGLGAAGPDGRPECSRAASPPHLLQLPGKSDLTLPGASQAAGGGRAGWRGVEAEAKPV